MKTKNIFHWMMAVALMSSPLFFTSCSDDDDEDDNNQNKTMTVGFENQQVNANGFWCGDESGVQGEAYGQPTYACTYTENGLTLNTTYAVTYWSGFAISNRTQDTFTMGNSTTPEGMPDQFNNVTGKAHGGKNFVVVQTYGETITFEKPARIKSLWYTNSAYTVNSIVNGDFMAEPFGEKDYLNCIITGIPAPGSKEEAAVEITLAEGTSYVSTWKKADLSSLGVVSGISFSFTGSKNNDWGLLTPSYVCIDDIELEYAE